MMHDCNNVTLTYSCYFIKSQIPQKLSS